MPYKKEAKPDYSLLCKEMLDPVARVLTKGIGKHGRLNYLDNPEVTDEELRAASGRHWAADNSNPGAIDEGEGGTYEQHIACMVANGLMLLHRRAATAAPEVKATEPRPAEFKTWRRLREFEHVTPGARIRAIRTTEGTIPRLIAGRLYKVLGPGGYPDTVSVQDEIGPGGWVRTNFEIEEV